MKLGDTLDLTRSLEPGRPAKYDSSGKLVTPARIGVSLSEFFDSVRPGELIWLDDGKIGGVVRSVTPEVVSIQITQARASGEKLGAEKGINAPDSVLQLSSVTKEDLEALQFVVKKADIVGNSFVRTEADVLELQSRLASLGTGEKLGIILKIETREGFDQLPRLLLAAMRSRAVGVMIARGDLAVECGYQRLAEVQEEILWICEAAHVSCSTKVLISLRPRAFSTISSGACRHTRKRSAPCCGNFIWRTPFERLREISAARRIVPPCGIFFLVANRQDRATRMTHNFVRRCNWQVG